MHPKNIDPKFLQERLDAIGEGLKEGIRREVQRLTDPGLPIFVERDGRVVDVQKHPRPQK